MQQIEEIMHFLDSNPIQILSTSYEDKPISRPIGSALLFEQKIWYCMNNDKPMFMQLQKNPFVCICACAPDFSWIRIHAKVVFSTNEAIKSIYVERPTSSFKDIHDKRLSIFYLAAIHAQIYKKGRLQDIIINE